MSTRPAPARVPNEVITASAGSGKTHALTSRYLRLLAAGAEPASLVALTFTRKAAGEFLDRIVGRLADASGDAGRAAELSGQLGMPDPFAPGDFLGLLRALTSELHRLNLGTLDSFFARLVAAAPFELGLSGEPEVVGDGASEEAGRRRVLDEVFSHNAMQGETLRAFLRALSEAGYGREGSRMRPVLERYVEEHHQLLLDVPDAGLWGNADAIWPDGGAPPGAGGGSGDLVALRAAFEDLRQRLEGIGLPAGQRQWWDEFFADAASYTPGATPGPRMEGVLKKLAEHRDALPEGQASFPFNRKKLELDAATGAAAREVLDRVAGAEVAAKLRRTRALRAVLGVYESVYDRRQRRAGKLAFGDLAVVLGAALRGPDGVPADLAYRTDSRLDHWLLDEFQDTSRAQWRVVSVFVDEVLQDPEHGRTYFQVGDKKQSIYGWRGGDPTLVDEVRETYRGHITERSLDCSYRSVPAVLDTVNRVFGDAAALAAMLPAGAVERLEWHEHVPAPGNADRPGFACLLHPPDDGGGGDPAHELALGVVREVDPVRRGLSCAVLCETQEAVRQVVDCFRAGGFNEVASGAKVRPGSDNPACGAVLSLLRAAYFPGDGFAAGHVRATPLAAALGAGPDAGEEAWGTLLERVLRQVSGDGFEGFVRGCAGKLEAAGALGDDPAFARHRLETLAGIAREFDAAGHADTPGFLAAAEGAEVEEAPDAGVVQVMTFHAAKGLGFDLVVLPDLKGKNLVQVRDGLAVGGGPGDPQWVLDPPRKLFRTLDPVLDAQFERAGEDSAFESLCRLYVAMTRPKQGLYLIAPERGKATACDFTMVLEARLAGDAGAEESGFDGRPCTVVYAAGQRRWFEEHPLEGIAIEDGAGAVAPAAPPPIDLGPRRRLPRRSPSAAAGGPAGGGGGGGDLDAMAFGREVHAAMATAGWSGVGDAASAGFGDPNIEVSEAVRDEVARCLAADDVRGLLAQPPVAGEHAPLLWREMAFEAIVDGEWVSGTFDRVTLERGASGFTKATVVDFKTDRVRDADAAQSRAAHHRPQVELYRKAVAQLTGLALENVAGVLVFTAVPAVVEVG